MFNYIEGIGCLYGISNFVKHREDFDCKKLEEYKILSLNSTISEDYNIYYNKILKRLGSDKKKDNIVEVVEEKKPIEKPEVDENILSQNFDFTPKKTTKVKETTYEKKQFNKLLYNSDNEEENDVERINLIESIDALKEELTRMEIKISGIPNVNEDSCMSDIKNVYKMLLYKKNVNIHFETSRDLILVGINQLVNFCDGRETSWGHRPNLIGWDRTAKLKLNALKTELSNLASDFFKKYEIGSLGQIALSLIPSALMHATLRSQQTSLQSNNNDALQSLHGLL